MQLTERVVQNWFWRREGRRYDLVCPNFYLDAFECDLCCVTRAGYVHEYEIKLTLQDFRADAQKREYTGLRRGADGEWTRRSDTTKHDRLEGNKEYGPARFYFLVPEALRPQIEVPDWAGLYTVRQGGNNWLRFDRVKQAPQRHKLKVTERVMKKMAASFYHRYWRERIKKKELMTNDSEDE